MTRGRGAAAATVLVAALVLASCSDDEVPAPAPSASTAAPVPGEPEPEPTASSMPGAGVPEVPTVTAEVTGSLATGLAAPWGVAELPDGAWLVTQRDTRTVQWLRPGAGPATPTALTGPGAVELADGTTSGGEGGLLGIAVSPTFAEDRRVYVYRTAQGGNEVLWGELTGQTLGALTPVLDAIPAASNHNGGQVAFGPDGFLYVTTGDAGTPRDAQNPDSLAGKILRVTPDGAAAPDNPVPGSPMWSMGHRNVQGIGWSADGRMFAAEFGQDRFDELNLVVAGGNYGWPDVEGTGGADGTEDTEDADGADGGSAGFVAPLVTWPTSDASPSGLAVTDEGVYLAGLRGETLWRVPLAAQGVGEPQALLDGVHGRLRAVVVANNGTLRVLTNNTDGRGTPRVGDDQLLEVTITPTGTGSPTTVGPPNVDPPEPQTPSAD
ncbi:PQQ-dependent sugar dehydrogenase [Sanguibacter sp. 25GB23B1]|uniref:PQQ-dependent sugar dehydrogenase n=1 Tax=unclassified Sanguibacter TaxID=2645534 RepID=UPI0032AFCCDF